MNRVRLIETLEKQEGYRRHPYYCKNNVLTIGIGRNLETNGISYTEAIFLLKNDISRSESDLKKIFPNFNNLPYHIKEVLVNMRFQLGPSRFRSFKKMIDAVNAWDFEKMKTEMMDSKWAKKDTPERAMELVAFIENGFKI
jgi:lysozyme